MIADVILGKNIDTSMWIIDLKKNLRDYIFVVDYEYYEEPEAIKGITYLSHLDAKENFKKFDSVCFYKSMYIYPGMDELKSSSEADKDTR